MPRKSLSEYVNDVGQAEAAAALGCTQGAISKAIKYGRNITVIIDEDGTVQGQEIRQFPVPSRDQQPPA